MRLPVSKQITKRPVYKRWFMRGVLNTEPMAPPTEEEKRDAIRVLEDPNNEVIPGMWHEAHRILDEASK